MVVLSFENVETKLLIVFGAISIFIVILGPIIWDPLVLLFAVIGSYLPSIFFQDPSVALLFRVDTFLYFIILGVAIIIGLIVLKNEEDKALNLAKLLVMLLFSATLYGDSAVWLITNNLNIGGLHEVHFFGFALPIWAYIYLSIITALLAIFIAMMDHWWQVILTTPYLWNLYLAQPIIYWPLRNIFPMAILGTQISLVALIINSAFTAFIIWAAFYVKKREESG
ncbi:MAG: hypothetical protein EAX96_20365 [Candidatus Lokiarchaeota archaeon]|nr:hypothetical protein [Candidatus Lokiarchaeota archaeon]